jgi:hypothetical protein
LRNASHPVSASLHSLDNGDSGLGDTSVRNLRMIPLNQETANSDFDTRQRVTFNGSYDLPFGKGRQFANTSAISDLFIGGWSAALTFAAQSGSPISITPNITTAAGGNAFAFKVGDPFKGGGRPNATNPSIACPGKVRNLTNWYNPCAFANPVPGSQITGTVRLTDRDTTTQMFLYSRTSGHSRNNACSSA